LPGVAASRFSTTAADSRSSSQRLARKVALITGEANGIGAATAREFVRDDLGRALAADLGGAGSST
jgi:short-subunit dehydrogenase